MHPSLIKCSSHTNIYKQKGGTHNMLHQIHPSEKASLSFLHLLKSLKINTLLRDAGIRKSSGFLVSSIFEFLLMLVFQGKNLDRFKSSDRAPDYPRKDTYYRFLNYPKYAWRKFLTSLAYKVPSQFDSFTSAPRDRVFILVIPFSQDHEAKKLN